MEIQNFTGPAGESIRIVMRGGEPWFVAKDVCDALGIMNGRDAILRLDDDERGVGTIDTPGGPQNMSVIPESGLYSLAVTSRRPEANNFKKWVMREVLPTIRKTGGFMGNLSRVDIAQMLLDAEVIAESRRVALVAAQPAIEFVAKFVEASATQPLRAVAKVLKVNERTFVAKLIEEGILYRLAGKLTPASQHMDAWRFEVKEIVAKNDHATTQMRFTAKGVEWIAGKVQDWNLGKVKA